MPELPEVETIREDLSKLVIGKKIVDIEVRAKKIVQPHNFSQILQGKKIIKIERRAKLLIFKISSGVILLVHLKMTGQLVYRAKNGVIGAIGGHPILQNLQELPNKFSHVIFTLADQSHLFFNDVRKFGYLKIVDEEALEKVKKAYGIEPFTKDFTLKNFTAVILSRPKMKIKQLLLDQKLIAGLGNIYSDEACFYAGIQPQRPAGTLQKLEIKNLFLAIIKVLKKSLKYRGTSSETYVDAYGRQGGFVPHLMVYGRVGEKCKKCSTKLVKLKIGGRTSIHCPHCQK